MARKIKISCVCENQKIFQKKKKNYILKAN